MATNASAPPARSDALQERLRQYESAVTGAGVKGARGAALEQLAAEGLDLFRLVQVRDAEWSDRVRSGEEPYTLESARPIGALYRLWLGPSEVLLAAIGSAGGTHAKPYDELNAACKTARFPAKVNLEGVLRGVGQMQRGEGIPLDEAMNELRRHRRAGGAG